MKSSTSQSFPSGHEADKYAVGDFILTHRGHYAGAAIRWGQRLRFRGTDRPYAYWSHAALIVSEQGDLVEALVKTGATRSHISKYAEVEYTLVRVYAEPLDQLQILRFADKIIGEHYGWMNDACVFLGYLTGGNLNFGFQGQINCSGLVARAQERMGAFFDRLPDTISPADLARYYVVTVPRNAVV